MTNFLCINRQNFLHAVGDSATDPICISDRPCSHSLYRVCGFGGESE